MDIIITRWFKEQGCSNNMFFDDIRLSSSILDYIANNSTIFAKRCVIKKNIAENDTEFFGAFYQKDLIDCQEGNE